MIISGLDLNSSDFLIRLQIVGLGQMQKRPKIHHKILINKNLWKLQLFDHTRSQRIQENYFLKSKEAADIPTYGLNKYYMGDERNGTQMY